MKIKVIISVIFIFFITGILYYFLNENIKIDIMPERSKSYMTDTIPVDSIGIDTVQFMNKHPSEGLMEAFAYYNVKHPEIVYAQAILETGHFKSDLCINGNNLFGLYNSRKKEFYTFNHWSESVEAYINFIQYKYKSPNDYYIFLKDLPYAEDPNYITKLKRIVNRNDKRGTSDTTIVTN